MSAPDGLDGKQILLIGEFVYATAAWDSLSALGRLRVRGLGKDPKGSLTHRNLAPHPFADTNITEDKTDWDYGYSISRMVTVTAFSRIAGLESTMALTRSQEHSIASRCVEPLQL